MKNIIVYGSLRFGQFNWEWFLKESAKYKGTITLDGYNLHSLGAYPFATIGSGRLIADIFSVPEGLFNRINAMELGAGYYISEIKIKGKSHFIWLYPEERVNGHPLIPSGDWTKK